MTSHFNPTDILIQSFVKELRRAFESAWGHGFSIHADILSYVGGMALEIIASTDALYHNLEHTMHVTLVGQEILRGKQIKVGGVTPDDWLNFIVSLLCHDIGYIKGVLVGDNIKDLTFSTGVGDGVVKLETWNTDAALTPYHVDRGKRFVAERFGHHKLINVEQVARNIELTRFPVPQDEDHKDTTGYPGLVRAADLMGQMSDPGYIRKYAALFHEFEETKTTEKLAYKNVADLRDKYPKFFWGVVHPYVKDALVYLRSSQTGQQYANNLFANVFALEHQDQL